MRSYGHARFTVMLQYLGAFTKLRKATIIFVMSVRLSAWNSSVPTRLIIFLNIFRKSVEKIQVLFKSHKNNWYFTWRSRCIYDFISQFFLEWQTLQTKVADKVETHILCSVRVFFFFSFYEIMCKRSCTAWQATDDIMTHAHCILDT
jgi:hypothetical protein